MEWTPDTIRALADRMERRLDRPHARISADTLRLVVRALRLYAAEGFGARSERLVIEVADLRRGTVGEVLAEVSDFETAEAVFAVAARRRPESRVTLRKRGRVLRERPDEPDPPT